MKQYVFCIAKEINNYTYRRCVTIYSTSPERAERELKEKYLDKGWKID